MFLKRRRNILLERTLQLQVVLEIPFSVAYCSAVLSHIPDHPSPYIWDSPFCLEKGLAIIPAALEPMWSEAIILFKLQFKNKILSLVIIVLH